MEGHLSPSPLQWVEGVCLPPPQTEGHWTPMGTPLQVRPQATGIGAGTAEGVGRRTAGTSEIGYANL